MPLPDHDERARILAAKAEEDATAVREMLGNPKISDRIVGFHAQQAIEKWLKAVIAANGENFLPRHDLDYLLDLLEEIPVQPIPIARDDLTALTVYAVPMRYEELADTEPIDRAATGDLIDRVGGWARAELKRPD